MKKSSRTTFSENVEKLVNPVSVGSILFLQGFMKYLPIKTQNKIIEKSAKNNPYMGFIVEPYSCFISYEIIDLDKASLLIPDCYELVKTKLIVDEDPKYYCIFGSFNVHTSAFWGQRMEFYIIAKHKKTGKLSWIIVDYDSNTISHDKKNGLVGPSVSASVIPTNFNGNIVVDVNNLRKNRQFSYKSSIANFTKKDLNSKLWINANFSIGYGRELGDNTSDTFSILFDPDEMAYACSVDINNLKIIENSWYPELFNPIPTQLLFFPYAQHFLSDSPGSNTTIESRAELIAFIEQIDFNKIEVYSVENMHRKIIIQSIASIFIFLILVILLVIK